MTPQEAVDVLERERNKSHWGGLDELKQASDAWKMAISALEKQIPMKPKQKKRAEEQVFQDCIVYVIPCGSCGESLNRLHDYCPWCGQKIDYGDDENDE